MNLSGGRLQGEHRTNAGDRKKLFSLIRENSFGFGKEITLSSGKKSNFYFNMKNTMLHPHAVTLIANLLCDRLQKEKVQFVGGLELGAIPLIAPVVAAFSERDFYVPGFLVRKKMKEHGTKKLLEGVENFDDRSVAILDDVTTSGGSAMDAVRVVQEHGGRVSIVLSVVDREEGATEFYKEQGINFDSLFKASEFLTAANSPSNSD